MPVCSGPAARLAARAFWRSAAPAQSTITGGSQALVLQERTLEFSGATTFAAGTIRGGFRAVLRNRTGATFTALGNAAFFADSTGPLYTFENAGTFIARSTTGRGFTSMDSRFDNVGTIQVELSGSASGHTLSLAGGGTHRGSIVVQEDTAVEFGNGTTLAEGTAITGDGGAIIAGMVELSGSVSAENLVIAVGELNVGGNALIVSRSATQLGGTLRIGTAEYSMWWTEN
jgi:hypothetical protein